MLTVALGLHKKAKLVTKFVMIWSRNFWTLRENCRGNGNVSTISTKTDFAIVRQLDELSKWPHG